MNLPKAIEILADSAYMGVTTHDQDFKDACKLGIEALKALNAHRKHGYPDFAAPLPGETKI